MYVSSLRRKLEILLKELHYLINPDLEIELGEIFKKLSIRNRSQFYCVLQYVQFLNFLKEKKDLKYGLELGAGYSTLLLATLASKRPVEIFSIDADTKKLKRMFNPEMFAKIDSLLNIISDYSISYKEIKNFYNEKHEVIAGTNTSKIIENVKPFINNQKGPYNMNGTKNQEQYLKHIFDKDEKLHFDKKFINANNRFYDELKVLEKEKRNEKGAIDKILNGVDYFDFIFFDCSEYSSIIEWVKLHNKMRIGGYAIFHDIYFPRSLKNFISCASVSDSKSWKVIYKDESTSQGLLIAKRIK